MKKIIAALIFLCVFASGAFAQTIADEWFQKAGEYFDKGDYANAITAYSEAIKRGSTNLDAYWFRGVAYSQIKNYDACIADCTTVIKDAPNFSTVYMIRGDAYGAKGVYHKAIADFKTGLEKGYDPSGFNIDKSDKADMWFCGAMYMEIAVNRFLGKSDVVTKYENRLKTVSDKNKVTRAEIEKFYRDNVRALIAAVVDEEFKKTRGGYVPYNVYVNSGKGEAIVGIKEVISQFFLNPNANNYFAVCFILNHFIDQISRGFSFARYAGDAYATAIGNLSSALLDKINDDDLRRMTFPATVQNDPAVRKVTQNTLSVADTLR